MSLECEIHSQFAMSCTMLDGTNLALLKPLGKVTAISHVQSGDSTTSKLMLGSCATIYNTHMSHFTRYAFILLRQLYPQAIALSQQVSRQNDSLASLKLKQNLSVVEYVL